VSLGLVAVAAWAAPGLAAHIRPSNKTAFVVALDGTTTPYKDLKKEDWGVREDGQDRKIIDAKPATDPLNIVILADVTKFMQMSAKDVRTGVASFIQAVQAAQPAAQIAIVGFGRQSTTFVELGKASADVDKAVQRINADPNSDATVMLEALAEAAKKLSSAASPRRAIVAVNLDGFNEVSSMPPQNVADQVIASHASLWSLTYQNAESARVRGKVGANREAVLNNLTKQTGGIRIPVPQAQGLDAQMKKVAEVLIGQYAVTYERPDGATPKLLQMAVARPGAQMLVPQVPPQ
jgi:hypothetical protein